MTSDESTRLWNGHRVQLVIANFKNNGSETLALVRAIGRVKLLEPVPRVIGPGRAFIVPLDELTEVPI